MEHRRNIESLRVVIVDADLRGDHRVQLSIHESREPVVLIDIRDVGSAPYRIFDSIRCIPLLLKGVLYSGGRGRLLMARLKGRIDRHWFSGMMACAGLLLKSVRTSARLRHVTANAFGGVTLHAHDLYCGVAAALAGVNNKFTLVYDAHELEIHRKRRAGWIRLLVEHWLEQFVLSRSTELRTVNAAILDVMTEWYKVPDIVRIVYNDFYPHREVVCPSTQIKPAIVYVGQGVNGRMLEHLDHASVTDLFHVHVFLLGSTLPSHIKAVGWERGAEDYEATLVALSREKRCMMWCCLENRCLSYELATPNKFFQALAIGAPIIASQGTYLAEIVLKYDIGAVFDGSNLSEIQKEVLGRRYEAWVTNVLWFRKKIRSGDLVI